MKTLSGIYAAYLLRDALNGLRSEMRKFNPNHDRLGRFASSRQYAPDKGTSVGGSTENVTAPALDKSGDDASIKSWIASPTCKKTLKQNDYDKHAPGTAAYAAYLKQRQDDGSVAQSRLTISREEAQSIINERAGTGELKRDANGTWTQKEYIDCGYIVGYTVGIKTGVEHPTSRATLHYSVKKKSCHLVPR